MYEEEHGVIYNSFFDKLLNKTINMGSRDEGQWSDPRVEPIWITATRQVDSEKRFSRISIELFLVAEQEKRRSLLASLSQ